MWLLGFFWVVLNSAALTRRSLFIYPQKNTGVNKSNSWETQMHLILIKFIYNLSTFRKSYLYIYVAMQYLFSHFLPLNNSINFFPSPWSRGPNWNCSIICHLFIYQQLIFHNILKIFCLSGRWPWLELSRLLIMQITCCSFFQSYWHCYGPRSAYSANLKKEFCTYCCFTVFLILIFCLWLHSHIYRKFHDN